MCLGKQIYWFAQHSRGLLPARCRLIIDYSKLVQTFWDDDAFILYWYRLYSQVYDIPKTLSGILANQ